MTTIRITTATPVWRGIAVGVGYGLFSAAVKYLAEGQMSLRETLAVGFLFGAILWGCMSMISEKGQINALLRRAGLIKARRSHERK